MKLDISVWRLRTTLLYRCFNIWTFHLFTIETSGAGSSASTSWGQVEATSTWIHWEWPDHSRGAVVSWWHQFVCSLVVSTSWKMEENRKFQQAFELYSRPTSIRFYMILPSDLSPAVVDGFLICITIVQCNVHSSCQDEKKHLDFPRKSKANHPKKARKFSIKAPLRPRWPPLRVQVRQLTVSELERWLEETRELTWSVMSSRPFNSPLNFH